MILDELIVLFVTIICSLVEGMIGASVVVINLIAGLIELIVGLFIAGFKLGRLEPPARDHEPDEDHPRYKQTWVSPRKSLIIMFSLLGVIGCLIAGPSLMKRKVTLLAEDGHTLPFAALIIHTRDGDQRQHTDVAGKVHIPRFTTTALTVNDPRYMGKTWQKSEIGSELTVGRTILGSSLDAVAGRLLKPSSKDKDKAND